MKIIVKAIRLKSIAFGFVCIGLLCAFCGLKTEKAVVRPRIVNIINFIRLLEPRDARITEDVLYQTVVRQVEIMRKYKLKGTFLLQYDALLDPRYQGLLKKTSRDSIEIGAWWEIPQPLVENTGLKWRGRYPWDWHADVGFSTGYTPAEREKLVDVYMRDFRKIFGFYPKSVGSWFIDAHTLNYLYTKYGIVASSNCKDQVGTDGYTLWGGYWNQAYYPSKVNAYMPAQTEKNQIPVPIFRMLGSDPVRQYDTGIGAGRQGVITLEPVYNEGGKNATWVNWFFREFVTGASMDFAYTQAGQENSFTWASMKDGYELQMPLIARLRDEKKVTVETLAESGQWFKDHYKVTPATSVTVNKDIEGSDLKTVWFNSRYYRANLLWEAGGLRIRDIHLFNENYASVYETTPVTSNECTFFTLPLVDGYLWSTAGHLAGLRFKTVADGKEILLEGKDPVISDAVAGVLHIQWPLKSGKGTLVIEMNEREMTIKMEGNQSLDWYLDMTADARADLPFKAIESRKISCLFDGMNYALVATKGTFSKPAGAAFRVRPARGVITFDFAKQGT